MTVGLTDRMMRMTAQYTSQREQFGRPIATFQAVAHRAADCYIDIECLRLVTQQAVALLQQGGDAREAVQVAKIWCGDVAHRLSQAAQHLHGGIGVDRDYPLFRYCLWARQLELSLGGSAMLKAELGVAIAEQYASA
jgi:alkylation response protein AidB-like acyl-CoA dehydrogenase